MKRKPTFHVPAFSQVKLLGYRSAVEFANDWLTYYRRLVSKPLTAESATELRAVRGFIEEASALTTICGAEFASATGVERKSVANDASDILEKVDAALAKFERDAILLLC